MKNGVHNHAAAKIGISSTGKQMHYSAGAIIKQEGKYLLIDRAVMPYGFACPAGHVDEGEDPEQSLKREVEEETCLKIVSYRLVNEEEVQGNRCSKDIPIHYWYVFECTAEGTPKRNLRETKSIGWYTKKDIKKLKLEPVWEYWFKKLKII